MQKTPKLHIISVILAVLLAKNKKISQILTNILYNFNQQNELKWQKFGIKIKV